MTDRWMHWWPTKQTFQLQIWRNLSLTRKPENEHENRARKASWRYWHTLMRRGPVKNTSMKVSALKVKWYIFFFFFPVYAPFLVACTRLCKPLCRSVGRSVGPSVGRSVGPALLFFRVVTCSVACARLMAISLVYPQFKSQKRAYLLSYLN